MKDSIKVFRNMTVAVIGYSFGCWVWNNVIEDKMDDFKDYLDSKRKEKGV